MPDSPQDSIPSEWHELTSQKSFILDLGFTPEHAPVKEKDGTEHSLERYAVFMPIPKQRKHQIVEVSANLQALQGKYKVPDDMVMALPKRGTTKTDLTDSDHG